jgi:hypothetical protein
MAMSQQSKTLIIVSAFTLVCVLVVFGAVTAISFFYLRNDAVNRNDTVKNGGVQPTAEKKEITATDSKKKEDDGKPEAKIVIVPKPAKVDMRPKFFGKWEQATGEENVIHLWEFRSDGTGVMMHTDFKAEWSVDDDMLNIDWKGTRIVCRFKFEANDQKLVLDPVRPNEIMSRHVTMKRLTKERESVVITLEESQKNANEKFREKLRELEEQLKKQREESERRIRMATDR